MQSCAGYLSSCCRREEGIWKLPQPELAAGLTERSTRKTTECGTEGSAGTEAWARTEPAHERMSLSQGVAIISNFQRGCSVYTQAAEYPEAVLWAVQGEGLAWEVSNGIQKSSLESPGLCPSHLLRGLEWNHCFADVNGKSPAIVRLGQDSPTRVPDTWGNLHSPTGDLHHTVHCPTSVTQPFAVCVRGCIRGDRT